MKKRTRKAETTQIERLNSIVHDFFVAVHIPSVIAQVLVEVPPWVSAMAARELELSE
jgi:hypothetical protein